MARSATSSWRGVRSARLLLWTAIAAYGAGFAMLSVLRHRAFGTGRFDLGNMVQAVWSTAHGHPLEVTSLQGEQFVRLGAHFDPILAALAPLWLLWPSPSLLLTVQAVALALGALPVFWLARTHLGSEWAALGFALAYLLLPALQWMTLADFHPVALATPLLLYAFWFLDRDRLLLFAATALLAAATKEHVALAVAGLGLWYALTRKRRAAGVAIAAIGVALAAVVVAFVIPSFSPSGGSSFSGRYQELADAPGLGRRGIGYLAQLLAPLAGLSLFAPVALLAAVPELGLNLLSDTVTQTSIRYHYSATAIAALVPAAVLGAARLRGARVLGGVVLVAALLSTVAFGPLLRADWGDFHVTTHDRIAAQALERIPREAVVSASNSLGAHLSDRRRILSFPYRSDAEWVAVDETRPGYADRIDPPAYAAAIRELRRHPHWRLAFGRDGVLLFRRISER